MSIIFNFISFILLYSYINNSQLKEHDTVSLVYYEYSYNLSEISLKILNPDASILDTTSCHLLFIKNIDDEKEIFDFYSSYINRQWIFFTNNNDTIKKLLEIDYDKNDAYLLGILIPEDLVYENEGDDIPIFKIDNNYSNYMEKWDMRNEEKNIFFSLKINHAIEDYPENYFLILSICAFLSAFSLLLYWKIIIKKVNPNNILPLHKIAIFLIYLNNLLCFILIIKSINIRGTKIYDDESESSILLDTALITLNGIHRTVLWSFLLLLSYGWNISLQQLSPQDCKFFLKMILALFFSLSIDQIIDVIFSPIFSLHISEIKNSIIYLSLIILMLYKIRKNINFLKIKIHYANLISPQYVNALEFKIKLFIKFRILIICYFLVFLAVLILHKTVFYKYDEVILESYDYLVLDCVFVYLFLLLFRPQELPENYNINLGDNLEGEDGNIYKYTLPAYSEAHSKIKDLTKKQVEECLKKELPIVIVGPNVKNLTTVGEIENEINNNINNNNSINKYFLNLNIGFANNNK